MNLLGKATDKEFWQSIKDKPCYESILRKLKKEYNKMLDEGDLKCHKYREFKTFFTTGERKVYEKQYYLFRQRAEAAAILSLIYPENQDYLDDLMDTLFDLCDEYTWCLPAHQGQIKENDTCHIDLGAAMTASQLAEIYTILKDRLDPLINSRIVHEINRRVLDSFLATEHYDWWELDHSNWAAVCIGGIARSMMLIRPEGWTPEFEKRVLASIDTYLSGLDDSGICFEGMGYWRYGFGHFVMCCDMLRTFTEGRIDYFKMEKVKNVAAFYQKIFLSGDSGVSFSDGGGAMRYPLYLLHYLKKEYPDSVLVYDKCYAQWDCMTYRSYTWYDDEIAQNPASEKADFESYSPEAQWMIKRNEYYGFAAKGGCNHEPHNHNDIGSFIFAKDGRHIFTDPGGGLYTRQYFDPALRYTHLECSSRGHSVPMIGDTVQSFGEQFKATDAKYENGVFSLDIAGAYECDGLTSIKRSFTFTGCKIMLTDEFTYAGDKPIKQRLVTRTEPEILSETEIKVDCGGVIYDPNVCKAEIVTENDSRDNPVYYIDFTLADGVKSSTLTIY